MPLRITFQGNMLGAMQETILSALKMRAWREIDYVVATTTLSPHTDVDA
jgi:hypothetical protein